MASLLLFSLAALSCATATGPCSLLTPADLGQTPAEMGANGTDCFYRLEPFADSVSLSAVPHARGVWSRMEKKDEAKGEEKEESHVREVEGVGDHALWSTLPVGSTLYVLKGETMLRISVGGKMDDAARLEKSIRLARAALRRLP
jgi:hypothetical protein